MRYLFGFLCVYALGVVPVMGCSESAQCRYDKDCDDQNECTDDECSASTNRCENLARPDGTQCDFDGLDDFFGGLDGICISVVCEENPCDDGNECTEDPPPDDDGSCIGGPGGTGCDGCYPCDWNGEPGVCIDGVCEEDPCKGVVCDDGDLCTNDRCVRTTGECAFGPVGCSDRNTCTDDTCDPDSGGCDYTPVPDGTGCCLEWSSCGWIFPYACCIRDGHCQNGECV